VAPQLSKFGTEGGLVASGDEEAKVNQSSAVTKPIPQPRFGSGVVCYYCKQPGHLKS